MAITESYMYRLLPNGYSPGCTFSKPPLLCNMKKLHRAAINELTIEQASVNRHLLIYAYAITQFAFKHKNATILLCN